MEPTVFSVARDVTPAECPWLDATIKAGTEVYQYHGYTYGCISHRGRAVTSTRDEGPFFELPADALESRP